MLTMTWGIDTLFEKLTRQIGSWIWKTPFGFVHYASEVEGPNLDKEYVRLPDPALWNNNINFFDVKLG